MRRGEGRVTGRWGKGGGALLAVFCLAIWPSAEASASVPGRLRSPLGGPKSVERLATVSAGDPRVHVPDAQKTIAMKMPAFRRCFERMHASGRVALDMTIVSDGAVIRARVQGAVPRDVSRCIESQALRTVFSEPEGGRTARLFVPVAYIRQHG